MILPGANGSVASRCSMKINMTKSGNDKDRDAMVIGAFHATLLPRSSPSSRAKTAEISTVAPQKSTRPSLVVQSEFSIFGSFKTKATAKKATAQRGACARKALGWVSQHQAR